MAITKTVARDVFPYLRIYKDGTIERYAGTDFTPAGFDSETKIESKDVIINHETKVSARIYRPKYHNKEKIPVLVYFHGGAFCIASTAEPKYHHCLNQIVSEANIIAVSVDYRLAPENPLPVAFEDSWTALQWVFSHVKEGGEDKDAWLNELADFDHVYLAGDSAGATIAHHLGSRVKTQEPGYKIELKGITLIHPYFWGSDPIGMEVKDSSRKAMVDNWWMFVCPSDKGCDDPYINPFVDGAPSVEELGCDRVLVLVAEKDILCDRGKLYYEKLMSSKWHGKAELVETKGEDHVFHIFNPGSESASNLIKCWASFVKV